MIKKKLFKKMLTIGLATAITAAMPVVVMAEEVAIGGNGTADCHISGYEGYAYASTTVYANYDADYIYADVVLKLDTISGGSGIIDYYVEDDWDETDYGRYLAVSAVIDVDLPANLRPEAYSYHDATIDDMSGHCELCVEY